MLVSAGPWGSIPNPSIFFLLTTTLEVMSWVVIQFSPRSLSTVQPFWGPKE